jgi:hypothetical protein
MTLNYNFNASSSLLSSPYFCVFIKTSISSKLNVGLGVLGLASSFIGFGIIDDVPLLIYSILTLQ